MPVLVGLDIITETAVHVCARTMVLPERTEGTRVGDGGLYAVCAKNALTADDKFGQGVASSIHSTTPLPFTGRCG